MNKIASSHSLILFSKPCKYVIIQNCNHSSEKRLNVSMNHHQSKIQSIILPLITTYCNKNRIEALMRKWHVQDLSNTSETLNSQSRVLNFCSN